MFGFKEIFYTDANYGYYGASLDVDGVPYINIPAGASDIVLVVDEQIQKVKMKKIGSSTDNMVSLDCKRVEDSK